MSVSWGERVQGLLRVGFRYLAGWRGLLIGLSAVASAVIVWVYSESIASALVTLVALGIPLLVVGVLLANQDSRAANNAAAVAATLATTSSDPAEASNTARTESDSRVPSVTPSDPLVAIVVTAWNESSFISEAIASIRAQTASSWECIIVDDRSTDDTVDKVLALVGGDPRFRVVEMLENGGTARARNAGLGEVRAPFVTFLDGDDFLYPNSVNARLEHAMELGRSPWVAGVYCQWSNVPETAVPGPTPDPKAPLPTVTWLTSLADASFIASAPLVRTDVLRSAGGFPPTATAEDTLTWNRILREGYVFAPVHEVGVAYRMKRVSAYRRTAVEHANLIADALEENGLPAEDLTGTGPFPFREPCTSYLWQVTRVRRMLGALASAVEANDDVAAAHVTSDVSQDLQPYLIWELPLDEVIRSQATRVTRYLDDRDMSVRRDRVANAMTGLLEPRVLALRNEVERRTASRMTEAAPGATPAVQPLSVVEQIHVEPDVLDRDDSVIDGRVILMPSASYHVAETGPLSDVLASMGIESVVMVSDYRWPLIEAAQAAYSVPVLASVEPGPWLGRAAALLVMNDWGDEYPAYVEVANALGVPTFAKVEGVQDFKDDDVGWDRKAYQRVQWVLAQGQNDVDALPMQDTLLVGSSRLERIWHEPVRTPEAPLAVINVNFTYDVLDGARDLWVDSAVAACKRVGIPFVLSLHPAERDQYSGTYPVANVPMRHLLTESSVLISRFSTVGFEAMARGVPFIYHNPHGEQVPTFQSPDGAFLTTTGVPDLVEALREVGDWQPGYRERAAAFFLKQVDVDPEASSEQRSGNAIATRLSP